MIAEQEIWRGCACICIRVPGDVSETWGVSRRGNQLEVGHRCHATDDTDDGGGEKTLCAKERRRGKTGEDAHVITARHGWSRPEYSGRLSRYIARTYMSLRVPARSVSLLSTTTMAAFTVKATYRNETRKFTFPDPVFPTYDQLYRQVCPCASRPRIRTYRSTCSVV